ncbi:hypothetical protein LC593_17410 [Nostoc sp. CHAB 5844]|nr:hypothetical protein [Nostoc sp. CHAB 5844]
MLRSQCVGETALWAALSRHLLQRGGSRVGGFPDLNGLPWEPPQRSGST